MRVVRRWLKEPLVHFILLGGALLALHRWLAPAAATTRIVVTDSVIRGLRQEHLRRSGMAPTAEEEAALIERFIDREVLYREALALGLDREDIIVRRRLVQKMQFLLEGLASIAEPSDAELEAYVEAHGERYIIPERMALTHVFASVDRHGADAERVAGTLRERLLEGEGRSGLGDPFLRGHELPLRSERELTAIFGAPFAARLVSLPVGTWSVPVRSSYGFHVVRIAERTAALRPPLAEIRTKVESDWREERRVVAERAALARLRQRYQIEVESSATTLAEVAASG